MFATQSTMKSGCGFYSSSWLTARFSFSIARPTTWSRITSLSHWTRQNSYTSERGLWYILNAAFSFIPLTPGQVPNIYPTYVFIRSIRLQRVPSVVRLAFYCDYRLNVLFRFHHTYIITLYSTFCTLESLRFIDIHSSSVLLSESVSRNDRPDWLMSKIQAVTIPCNTKASTPVRAK